MQTPLDSLLRANAYPLEISHGLAGAGLAFMLAAARDSQFFLVGETHDTAEIPGLTSALFGLLHDRGGYDYVALETDPVFAEVASEQPVRGNESALASYVRMFPMAPEFATDQELTMIANIGTISKARRPIWGIDQMMAVHHALVWLLPQAPDAKARAATQELIALSARVEKNRDFKSAKLLATDTLPPGFFALPALYKASKPDASFIADQLVTSWRIYHNYRLAEQGQLTGYESNRESEETMKTLFLRSFSAAAARDGTAPKVLIKCGHAHIFRGRGSNDVWPLGSFVSDLAIAHGSRSFHLAVFAYENVDDLKPSATTAPFANLSEPRKPVVYDLRPLRAYVHAGRVGGLSAKFEQLIFDVDAVLVLGPAHEGSHAIVPESGL